MAWWRLGLAEARRQGTRLDPRAVAVMAVVGLGVGALFVFSAPPAPHPQDGLWVVQSDQDAFFLPAAQTEPRFRVQVGDRGPFDAGDADIWLDGRDITAYDTDRGRAAVEVLGVAARQWLNGALQDEDDVAAAFPVSVTVAYQPRTTGAAPAPPTPPSTGTTGPAPDPGTPPTEAPDILDDTDPAQVQRDIRPDEVDPPFPIRSLLLTFAYILPAGLLAQVQAANLHGERTRRRGVLLLSAPVTPGDILLGKSVPALALTVLIGGTVTWLLGAGWLAFLASLSFLGFLYAATTFLAVVSRSPRELSLSQVAVTTLLNVFLFLPAMFPSIPPVAFLSPVHVVASGIRGDAVSWGQFLYATLPLALAGVGLAALAVGLMREELLFSVRSATRRVLDAMAVMTRRSWRVLAAGVLVVPFVFAAEILVLVTSAVMGLRAAFVIFLPLSVLMEEAAKGMVVWSRHRQLSGTAATPWRIGVLAGAGFFLGEKGYLVLTLVGFDTLPFGDEALAILGTGPGILLLMVPLLLHVATAWLLAAGSARGATQRWVAFGAAVLIHLSYDQVLLRGVL